MEVKNRLAYVPIELLREARSPLRGRFALARRGLDRRALHARQRAWLPRHPLGALSRVIGNANRTGPIWGVTMVKDEEVRVEGALRRLVADGVDVIVVADNLSTDRTRDILEELARELPLIVLRDSEIGYYQSQKISLLARAAARCGASWIVPFDGDELWFGVDGTIRERLRGLAGDVAPAPMFDFLPTADVEHCRDPYTQFVRRTANPVTTKVAFRAHLLAWVATGNHSVSQPGRRVAGALAIRHYPFLGFEHFANKARRGTASLERTDLPANIGGHWREWARQDDPELREEWSSLCTQELVYDPLPVDAFR